eukprot:scaffold1435_cov267-Pinguiococcus_pyrenoidosus.AAC.52
MQREPYPRSCWSTCPFLQWRLAVRGASAGPWSSGGLSAEVRIATRPAAGVRASFQGSHLGFLPRRGRKNPAATPSPSSRPIPPSPAPPDTSQALRRTWQARQALHASDRELPSCRPLLEGLSSLCQGLALR